MKDRDQELDDLVNDLKGQPYIERPDNLDIGKGGLCWLDGSRLCGADCVAFDAQVGLDQNGHPVDSPEKCLVLATSLRQAEAAASTIAVNRKLLKDSADKRRNEALTPKKP